MAVYWQPPIVANPNGDHLPVRDEDKCAFSLFMIVEQSAGISSAEIVDWEYDVFLGEQFRSDVKNSGLTGWTEFMTGFKQRHREEFVENAFLTDIQLGESYDIAETIIAALVRWIAKKKPGWELIKMRIPPKL